MQNTRVIFQNDQEILFSICFVILLFICFVWFEQENFTEMILLWDFEPNISHLEFNIEKTKKNKTYVVLFLIPLMSMLILSHCCLGSVDIWSGRKQMFSKQQLIISLLYFGVEHVLLFIVTFTRMCILGWN